MKIRVYKRQDGTIIKAGFSRKCHGGFFREDKSKPIMKDGDIVGYEKKELNFDNIPVPDCAKGLPYIDIEIEENPILITNEENYIEQLYFDGDIKDKNIKKDVGWERNLMPTDLIAAKHQKNCENRIDEEFKKDNPDMIFISRNLRDIDRCKKIISEKNLKEGYELALNNLDERVANGESDKIAIREKLKSKIKELSE